MNIALMTNNYKPITGGVPISIERLANGLGALGHNVTIFAPTYKEQNSSTESASVGVESETNVKVFRYDTFLNHFIGGIVLPNPFDKKIEEEFRKGDFDLIHVHHPMIIGRTAVYLAKKYNVPLVFTYHTRYEQYVKTYTNGYINMDTIMPYYLHTFMTRCNFVFAPTPGMKQYLSNVCKIDSKKIGILPTGIEKSHFCVEENSCEELRKYYHAENIPLLISVSRMANEKNVDFLLHSLTKVKVMYTEPFRVLMIGDGPDKKILERKSLELGLEQEVIFVGNVPNEEIAPFYKAADGFIFASKTETQGIVILEAFAGGTPVVAVKASGVEDFVKDDVNGILTAEDEDTYAFKLAGFLKAAKWKSSYYDSLVHGATVSAQLYDEEAVAQIAEHYYNNVVADYILQKKRSIKQWTRDIVY